MKDQKPAYRPIIAPPTRREDDVKEAHFIQEGSQPQIQTALVQSNRTEFLRQEDDRLKVNAKQQTQSHLVEATIAQKTLVPAFYKAQGTVEMPSNISIEKDKLNPSIKIIRLKWVADYGLLGVAIFCNALTLPCNVILIINGDWGGLLMVSLHTTVGICLAYCGARQMMNSTYITMDGMNIQVDHRPIRICTETITFPMNLIGEVCCKKCVTDHGDRGVNVYFEVHVICNDMNKGRKVLVSDLETLEEALFIAQEIENFSFSNRNRNKGDFPAMKGTII